MFSDDINGTAAAAAADKAFIRFAAKHGAITHEYADCLINERYPENPDGILIVVLGAAERAGVPIPMPLIDVDKANTMDCGFGCLESDEIFRVARANGVIPDWDSDLSETVPFDEYPPV